MKLEIFSFFIPVVKILSDWIYTMITTQTGKINRSPFKSFEMDEELSASLCHSPSLKVYNSIKRWGLPVCNAPQEGTVSAFQLHVLILPSGEWETPGDNSRGSSLNLTLVTWDLLEFGQKAA